MNPHVTRAALKPVNEITFGTVFFLQAYTTGCCLHFKETCFISCASVCDGLFSVLDDVRCLFFVEKKRCCFSAFLFGGTLRFRVRVTGVSLAALSATIVELR